jgi:hypothetical protein
MEETKNHEITSVWKKKLQAIKDLVVNSYAGSNNDNKGGQSDKR